jgi:5'-deoxynucleotidase YfbR-like HD superfamily hydrolase
VIPRPIEDMNEPVICTSSGRRFNLLEPCIADVALQDIAHALALTPRFGGHCNAFLSVAQHSILVADLVAVHEPGSLAQQVALLHDASEAYLVDMPAPIKRHLPDFKRIEDRVQAVVFEAFGLATIAAGLKPIIKAADTLALQWEQRDFGPYGDWLTVAKLDLPTIEALDPVAAEAAFLARFKAATA